MSDLGLQSGLPTYDQLCEASHGQRRSYFVMRPSIAVSGWSQYSGSCYTAQLDRNYRGLRRDVIGVKTLDNAPLTRKESLADCVSTANSYYYDPDQEFSLPLFNWDSSYFDIGVLGGSDPTNSHYWDQFTQIYVNIGGADPDTTVVLCELGFCIGQDFTIQPSLGETNLVTDGGFETWTSDTNLTNWTEGLTDSGDAITKDSSPLGSTGLYSVRIASVGGGSSSTSPNIVSSAITLVAGKRYRIAGRYLTSGDCVPGLLVYWQSGSYYYVSPDGRTYSTTIQAATGQKTDGITRRFTFDFIAPTTSVYLALYCYKGTGTPGYVVYDDVTVRRVWRLETYEARIARDDVPPATQSSPGIFFGGKSVGVGAVSFRNADGAYDLALGQLTWVGHEVQHYVGGSIPGVGAIDREEWDRRFTGIVQSMSFSDDDLTLELEDARTRFHKDLPPNVNSATDTNIEVSARGKPKPMLFGGKTGIRPQRVGYNGSYGQYLVADCTDAPNGIKAVDYVWAYESEEAATAEDTAARLTLQIASASCAPVYKPRVGSTVSNPTTYTTALAKSTGSGSWTDNVACSVQALYGDGYVEFISGSTTTGIIAGLTTLDKQAMNETDILFGAYMNGSGTLQARSNGVSEGSTYAHGTSTKIRIERVGSTLYLKYSEAPYSSWTTLRTFTATSSAPLQVKVSIYSSGGVFTGSTLYGFGEVTVSASTGKFSVYENVKPIRVTLDNQFINFTVGGSELTATIPVGLYSIRQLSCEVAHQMKAATGASAVHCYYTNSTDKITLSVPSGTLTLKIQDGANKDASAWGLLGYSRDANNSGSTSYVGDVALWDVAQIDTKAIIRCNARGYIDDGSGTVTGTANALIERGTDVCRAIILYWLDRPSSEIDTDSFVQARTLAPESIALYLQDQVSSAWVFERLENSNCANIVIGGNGSIYYVVYSYDGEVADLQSYIEERDYIERPVFKRQVDEVFRSVTILYDQHPVSGNWRSDTASDPEVAARFKRIETKQIESLLRFQSSASALAGRMLSLAQRPVTRVKLVTHAKLFRKRIGDIIAITRKRALSNDGALVARPFRIISIAPDAIMGRVEAEAVEAQALVAGYACISTCQDLCQMSVQSECSSISQASCDGSSQSACTVSCQNCGEATHCETVCESTCQACAQGTNCQDSCEAEPCQTCQGGCQTGGEGCTVGCEVACEVCNEASHCEDACESTCQGCVQSNPCESCGQASNCQTCAQGVGCESCGESGPFCEVCGQGSNCETTCQLAGCEEVCEFACQTCQNSCQTSEELIIIQP